MKEYKYFVGDGAANLIRRALAAGGDEEGVHFDETFARYKELFAVDCMYEVEGRTGRKSCRCDYRASAGVIKLFINLVQNGG